MKKENLWKKPLHKSVEMKMRWWKVEIFPRYVSGSFVLILNRRFPAFINENVGMLHKTSVKLSEKLKGLSKMWLRQGKSSY